MRHPVAVKLGAFVQDDYRLPVEASLAKGAEVGRQLARLLLPDDVWRLLGESLRIIVPQATLGLRLRLCLDDDLIDLPWEFLYRRDVEAQRHGAAFCSWTGAYRSCVSRLRSCQHQPRPTAPSMASSSARSSTTALMRSLCV